MIAIDFYLDFLSSFGYLARGRLCEIAKRHGACIVWHPADIFRLRELAGNTGPSNSAIPAKLAYMTKDARRWADLYGLTLVERPSGWQTGVLNRGLLLAADRGEAEAYAREAYSAIWAEGLDPGAEMTGREIDRRMGWAPGTLADFAATADAQARYDASTTDASKRGVFGVPTFCIGDEMWWGNDRLDFLEHWLAARA